ncbi:hypothetical protein [Amycolatopsis cihanbeyliensis]|nr:hypothetical protein [Amycolatopsis cihanbeyliensis]
MKSTNPRDARNEYLKDRSLPGYNLVPPVPEAIEARPPSDDWYDGFRVRGGDWPASAAGIRRASIAATAITQRTTS